VRLELQFLENHHIVRHIRRANLLECIYTGFGMKKSLGGKDLIKNSNLLMECH
jgi:hypothetical protein